MALLASTAALGQPGGKPNDRDGDGWPDEQERQAGTDPRRRESFPKE